ncbi:MAG: hypothetical protein V4631_07250 [Pseudomonadota bacterium]
MKLPLFLVLLAIACLAQADCPSTLPLKGTLNIDNCDPSKGACVDSGTALLEYVQAQEDDGPEVFSIALHGGPWHLYRSNNRILGIDELAEAVRRQGGKVKRVVLYASWSGVAPDSHTRPVAQKLSAALGGMPVTGQDGFVWFAKDGSVHTTRQAFSGVEDGLYRVRKGDKVMASLAVAWVLPFESAFATRKNADGLTQVGVGHDIFMLCRREVLRPAQPRLGDQNSQQPADRPGPGRAQDRQHGGHPAHLAPE